MAQSSYLEAMNDRCLGMRSKGRGPDSANVVRFIAGSTGNYKLISNIADQVSSQSMNIVS